MHSIPILQTEEDCSRGTSIHRVNPIGSCKIQLTDLTSATRGSIRDCALSQQTHQKGCRHWLIHPLKSPSPLPLPAPRSISYPHPVYAAEKTEDTRSSTSHHSSVSHPALFSPKILPNICGKPVCLGTHKARSCTVRSLSWQGNRWQIHCSKHLSW